MIPTVEWTCPNCRTAACTRDVPVPGVVVHQHYCGVMATIETAPGQPDPDKPDAPVAPAVRVTVAYNAA